MDRSHESLDELDNVVNLSDRQLTEGEFNILHKGLNFCPTPGDPDMGEICRDLDKYYRSLCIQCWLNKKNSQHTPNIPVGPFNDVKSLKLKPNSEWNPPAGPPNLRYIIASNETGLLKSETNVSHSKRNMSRNEVKLGTGH